MITEEKNRMIADFQGMQLGEDGTMYYDDAENLHPPTPVNELKFHTSWGWLMPVVEKIESITGGMLIGRMFCEIEYQDPIIREKHFKIRIASGVKMNAIHEAIVQFIEWYNENK